MKGKEILLAAVLVGATGDAELSSLGTASGWINTAPLTPAALRGKVVLIDFWTYTCINWLRTLPYVRAWAEKYLYSIPPSLALNAWALSGNWTMGPEATVLNMPMGRVVYRFHARDLHLVMGPGTPGKSVRFRVLIDGEPPGAAHGVDVDEQGNGVADGQRMYQLIRQSGSIGDRQFEIQFLDAGMETFAFTFG
jgi:hypothetical protein